MAESANVTNEVKLRGYLKRTAADLDQAQRRLEEVDERKHEPIAIVGMSCRYPGGVSSPQGLWELTLAGTDATSDFPADRGWDLERLYDPDPDNPGTSYAREGGFLANAGEFDAEFFGIGPREALAMDPQQRLLLEASWEALEDAGMDPSALRGSAAGVFAGLMYHDYGTSSGERESLEGYFATGGSGSVASGRISYSLGLEGPAITVDTACSSSLVAMHLATGALRGGECSFALAGGATVIGAPEVFIEFSRQRGLAPDGRCKSFSEAADGVGWAEGVGMLALERLSDAQANGHPVLAVIRGSAVNQDGASNGLTAPNGPSQERVIRQALANARLTPQDIDAVEAHGTGTTLGDPIEAGALLATYGQDRDTPLRLGSIKSNIGHTQAAAGVAGVIKTVMAMREGLLPKSLHIDQPSAKVDWSSGEIELLSEAVEWKEGERPRRAGVSSFGISGTNAHLILEEAPAQASPGGAGVPGEGSDASSKAPLPGPTPLLVSAKSKDALQAQAARLAAHLKDNPELDLEDLAFSLATTRSSFEHRAVLLGADRKELLGGLDALSQAEQVPGAVVGQTVPGAKLAYLFSGQGSQRVGMGKELHEAYPLYRQSFEEICALFDQHLDKPLKEIVLGTHPQAEELLADTTYAQPALFALEVSLARLLESYGLIPDLLCGHSVGEISAAHISGVFDLPDATKLLAARAGLMGALPKGGAMIAIGATQAEVAERLQGKEQELSIAAINAPSSVVISGLKAAVEQVGAHFQAQGKKTKRLSVSHAFHSPLIEPMLEDFAALAQTLTYNPPQIPVLSNASGAPLTAEQATDPAYWVTHVREPVRFAECLDALHAKAPAACLELGPDPVLSAIAEEHDAEAKPAFTAALRQGRPEAHSLATALATAHAHGVKVNWATLFKGTAAKAIPLPTYAFQRRRYWLNASSGAADASSIGQADPGHPLLGAVIEDPTGEAITLTGRLSLQSHPWLADHAVAGTVLLPGTAFLEAALAAGQRAGTPEVKELTLQAPLLLPQRGAVQLQVNVSDPDDQGTREVSIHSRPEPGQDEEPEPWTTHAQGTLCADHPPAPEPLSTWPPEGAEPIDTEDLYERVAEAGFDYGPAFQGLQRAWRLGEEVYAEVELAEEQRSEAQGFAVHPALLEVVLAAIGLSPDDEQQGSPALPFAWRDVYLLGEGAERLRVRLSRAEGGASISFADGQGEPLGRIGSLDLRPLDPALLAGAGQSRQGLLAIEWQEASTEAAEAPPTEAFELHAQPGGGAEAAREAVLSALEKAQQWLASEQPGRLAFLTRGAVATWEAEPIDLALASAWGLLRSAQSEHPDRFSLIDSDGSEASEEALMAALCAQGEPQLALREGVALAPRAARFASPDGEEGEEGQPAFDPERTILITGATGAIGALVARHLVETHGARRLLLASRRGLEAEGARDLRAILEELGAEVTLASCDVSDPSALEELLASIPPEHPLGAVIHAAGLLDDATIEGLSPERVDHALAPKAAAAWHLHELTKGQGLSAFILFSSAASALGAPGQGNYAAANAFLDALAQQRHREGLPATSIAWGLWQRQSAMTAHLGEMERARIARSGVRALGDEHGLALFDQSLGSEREAVLAVDLGRGALRAQVSAGTLPALLRGLVRGARRRAAITGSLGPKLASLSEAEREPYVLELVRAEVAAVLGHDSPQRVDPTKAFKDLGFDSLAAVELRNRLVVLTGLRLPATVVFDYPNSVELTAYLLREATGAGDARAVAVATAASEEPIAIVGMACRYPGATSSPAALWQLVAEGTEAISSFPADRGWDLERLYDPDPDSPGTSYAKEGGFLEDAGDFDAEFFGIAPREALAMDPQQRLLLEVSWEALEGAGIDPVSLRGGAAGVFAGVNAQSLPQPSAKEREALEGYFATGMAGSVASGRISYALGLEGPAITVDTACSSSLVAMHLAAQAVRAGECTLALAGGATVLATPETFVEFSRQRGLAPDGRCKSFSEAADGVGWAEGVGMLALERLSDAQANGHPVLAVIRGSAVNQDGASNGLTAPNGPSQERVIRQALANARLTPQDIDAVEAHGTGTTLGDPIEAGALLATYGQDRDTPLRLGSIKSNIGHTQAAAGVAGVIKTVMAMREGLLPKSLHIDQPSAKVDWSSGEIELLSEAVEWKEGERPRRAGVSSFGISGTNAHLILEEAPAQASPGGAGVPGEGSDASSKAPLPGPTPLLVSAKSKDALQAQAARLAAHLKDNPELDLEDLAFSLATTRSSFEQRAVALGSDRKELLEGLDALSRGADLPGLVKGRARSDARPVFLFSGQGAQHARMAAGLLEGSPAFAANIAECETALSPFVDWSLAEVLVQETGDWLDRLDVVQPALFAVMVSLAELWRESGVRPAAVVGHSQGEIAAAHIAGGLSLQDAARVVALRAKAMAKIAGAGGMLSVSLPAAEASRRIAPFAERVSLAAINGPASVVLSGEPDALGELRGSCEKDGVRTRPVAVDYAAHSAQIEALEEELLDAFAPISPRSGEIPFHSTVSGEALDTAELDAGYWYRNLRQTVRFEPALRSLLDRGHRAFLEVSPHPVLSFGAQETIEDALADPDDAVVLETLRREQGGPERFALALATAHAHGVALGWPAFFEATAAKAVPLPTYAFQRRRYWLNASSAAADASSIGQADPDHPLLGAVIEDPTGEGIILTGRISLSTHPWLADHTVAGSVLLPGTAFLEAALAAGQRAGTPEVEELTLQAPLLLPQRGAVQLQVNVSSPGQDATREVSIHSRAQAGQDEEPEPWTCHAQGILCAAERPAPEPLGQWPPQGAQPIEIEDLYERFAEAGFEYGPAFQGLRAAWREGAEVYAEVELGEEQRSGAQGFAVHPALLDSALHAIGLLEDGEQGALRLPFAWSGVALFGEGADRLRVKLSQGEEGVSVTIADEAGAAVGRVGALALREVDPTQLGLRRPVAQGLLAIEWKEAELGTGGEGPAQSFELVAEPGQDRARAAGLCTALVLEKVQGWLAEQSEGRLAILTRGAIATSAQESPDPALAAAWGLVRSAQSEHPDRFLLVDSDGSEASRQALEQALGADGEPQIALREGRALVARASALAEGELLAPPPGPWRLGAVGRGTLEGLALVPNPEAQRPLGPSEVRVGMRASGLNFRDVLIALGLFPGQGAIGGEGAGVVVEVGSEVTDLTPGQAVLGMLPDTFASLTISDRALLAPIPEGWSFEQAAAIPIVFLTAYHGLFDLAALAPAEKVLIHAGAGGVGMAAIQLARHLGAEVFATASPAKHETLRELGLDADHIASSRDLDFKQKFLELTGGEGVDVVLNSLAGEFVDASLALLPRGGRFLEMGKTDVRDSEQVAAQGSELSYRAFDLTEVAPKRLGQMLAEILELFARGSLQHCPLATWDMRDAREAFRHLREGRNVGKVVLEVPGTLDPEQTILITGATGTLASLLARHLVKEHGARNLLLASRSAPSSKAAKDLQALLAEQGAQVTLAACDVSDRAALARLFASIPQEHPLGAVIHTAGLLDDATIEGLSPERIEAVFAPKATAAQHLHELTEEMELSAFVLFSSAAGVLGAPGQGNYAAANAFLDALAGQRRAAGLPATSIAWGLWQRQSAMTSHLGEVERARMARSGIEALSDQRGLELFDQALGCGRPDALALGLDRAALRAQASAAALPAILTGLVRAPRRARSSTLSARLASAPPGEREALVLELVRSEVAAVLGHGSPQQVEPTKAFKDLGFDSLAAVELRNRLATAAGLRLGATVVFDYPNAKALAAYLLGEAGGGGPAREVTLTPKRTQEPIAILGMACRFPGGVSSPAALWQLLSEGRGGISDFPDDRGWDLESLYDPDPDSPGTSYTQEGGFLDDAGDFDAEFFGIGPREALAMDPQQRLLLEACWEALEDARVDPGVLRETPAGVFVGLAASGLEHSSRQAQETEGYRLTGAVNSVASGRISYSLGLEGPAITVDTACSSSLVAMHLAAQALRGGECSFALAGGATVIGAPEVFIEFSRQRGLSPDGRCKSFADAADGTGFAEGVGMLALERLSDAQANGHPVLAVIRGSAVNQDGASNGLTAPNGPSQERVIRQALANARLTPQDIDAVEAHGTGTTLGDPIEAGALLATYGQDRDTPLRLGSIKSNIGHTQAAAGVAGVIKTVMAMREGLLPKSLHIDQPSAKVDWNSGEIELLSEAVEWKEGERPRRAGVSSFGISGTNAHLILEEAPAQASPGGAGVPGEGSDASSKAPLPGPTPLLVSAKSKDALQAQAARLAAHLKDNPELDLEDLAFSLATTRSSFEQRAVLLGADRKELLGGLDALSQAEQVPGAVVGQTVPGAKLAYLFSGQGSQRVGMGKELHEAYPLYRQSFEEICALFDQHLDKPLKEIVLGTHPQAEELLADTTYAQPALFALEVSLARLLESYGLIPDLLCGHSVGEISAAHISGVFDLPDATKLLAARAGLMGALPKGGAMIAIGATQAEVAERLQGKEQELSIAAINAPSSVVISGLKAAVEQVGAHFQAQGKKTKRLSVSHAFHSPLIEPMLADFAKVAKTLTYNPPQVTILSNANGHPLSAEQATDPAYWVTHVREPVRFAEALAELHARAPAACLELGPDPVLSAIAEEHDAEAKPAFTAALRQGRPEAHSLATALATAHAHGVKVNWATLFKGTAAKAIPLPTYAFQRRRYWLNASSAAADASSIGQADPGHPLLGAVIEDPTGEAITLTGRLSLQSHPWLADHAVAGTVLLPGTAFLEAALAAGQRAGTPEVKELTLQAPLLLPQRGAVQLQVNVSDPDDQGTREVSIHSRPEPGQDEEPEPWSTHAQGTLCADHPPAPEPLSTWPPEGAEPIDTEDLYERVAEAGFDYGPAFQGLQRAWRLGEEVYAEVELAEEQRSEAQGFAVHPALLDAALHAIALLADEGRVGLRMPFAWNDVATWGEGAGALRVKVSPREEGVTLDIADAQGAALARVGSLGFRPLDPSLLVAAKQGRQGLLGIEWREAAPGEATESPAELFEFLAEPGRSPAEAARKTAGVALGKVQDRLASEVPGTLAILTRGAVAVGEGESPDPVLASAWGLLRSAQSEHPGRFLLVDSDGSEASNEALTTVLCTEAGGEPQIALREGKTLVPRVTRLAPPPGDGEGPPTLDPERTILITGGTGALGGLVARRLVERHGARHLLLTSRRGPAAEDADDLRAVLEELGAEVEIAACDVAEPKSLKALLDSIPKEHPLGVVIHAAGLVDDATIAGLTSEHLGPVFAAKADAAWHLHELTAGIDLSAFVLFSSAAAAFGAPGQGNYAAANAFLDALAGQRRAAGLPATSIAWGLWQRQSAMTAHLGEVERARMARSGVEALDDEDGLDLFDQALGSSRAELLAVGLDQGGLRSRAAAGDLPGLLRGLVRVPARRRTSGAASFAKRISSTPAGERMGALLDLVGSEVAAVLGHGSADAIDPERAFKDLGFDSLAAVELRNRLSAATGLPLAPTTVFDYPTPATLAGHLLANLGVGDAGEEDLGGELSRLTATLTSLPAGDPSRSRVAAQLRALATSLERGGASELASSSESERLKSASDEELLEFIDSQVGLANA